MEALPKILWKPDHNFINQSNLFAYMKWLKEEKDPGEPLPGFLKLSCDPASLITWMAIFDLWRHCA